MAMDSTGTIYASAIICYLGNSGSDARQRGIYCSSDQGRQWTSLGFPDTLSAWVDLVSVKGNMLYVGTSLGLYSTPLDTVLWTRDTSARWVSCLNQDSAGTLIVGTTGGVLRRTRTDTIFHRVAGIVGSSEIAAFALLTGGGMLAGSQNGGIFLSTDGGSTWLQKSGTAVFQFVVLNSGIIMAATGRNVIQSLDGGNTWSTWGAAQLTFVQYIACLNSDTIYVSRNLGDCYALARVTKPGSWTTVDTGDYAYALVPPFIDGFGGILEPTSYRGLRRSTDAGNTWTQENINLPGAPILTIDRGDGGSLVTGLFAGAPLRSADGGVTWNDSRDQYMGYVSSIAHVAGGRFYCVSRKPRWHYNSCVPTALFASSDAGAHWYSVPLPGEVAPTAVACFDDTDLYVTSDRGIIHSRDGGMTWIPTAFTANSTGMGRSLTGRLFTSRYWQTWKYGEHFAVCASDDQWTTWSTYETTDGVGVEGVDFVQAVGGPLYSDFLSIRASSNDGVSWVPLPSQPDNYPPGHLLAVPGNRLFYCGVDSLSWTLDQGATWARCDRGLSPHHATCLTLMADGRLLCGTDDGRFYRTLLPVGVGPTLASPPDVATISCVPNPASEFVRISFSLSSRQVARIEIVDPLGRTVQRLVEGSHASGEHMITWSASGFPSGLYSCRLETTGRIITKNVLVVR